MFRRMVLCGFAAALCLVSCTSYDYEKFFENMLSGDLSKGTDPMTSVSLGRYSSEDRDDIEKKIEKKKKVTYSNYTLLPYFSLESQKAMEEMGGHFASADMSSVNMIDLDDGPVLCRLSFEPFTAQVKKVTFEVADESILSFRSTDDVQGYYIDLHQVGETDVRVTAEGINTVVVHYHFKVTGRVALMLYTDAFWLNNLTARLKYKTKKLPKGVSSLYMNVRDSATVIGYARGIDQRKGDKTFNGMADTTTYPVKQHTDKFRKGKRIILRNVSDAVRKYNSQMVRECWIKVDETYADALSAVSVLTGSVPYTVKRNGDAYILEMAGQTFNVDKYQLYWINRTVLYYGSWPANVRFKKVDGQCWMVFDEPFMCKQIQLAMDVVGNNPYIMFDYSFKKSQEPSSTDDDEDDPSEDFRNEAEDVVDSLGTKLMEYFTFTFVDSYSSKSRDSLSRELNRIISEVPDSIKWKLNY